MQHQKVSEKNRRQKNQKKIRSVSLTWSHSPKKTIKKQHLCVEKNALVRHYPCLRTWGLPSSGSMCKISGPRVPLKPLDHCSKIVWWTFHRTFGPGKPTGFSLLEFLQHLGAIQNLQNLLIFVAELAWLGGDKTSFLKPKQSKTCHGKVHLFQIWVSGSVQWMLQVFPAVFGGTYQPFQLEDVTEIHPVLLFWGWEQSRKDLEDHQITKKCVTKKDLKTLSTPSLILWRKSAFFPIQKEVFCLR